MRRASLSTHFLSTHFLSDRILLPRVLSKRILAVCALPVLLGSLAGCGGLGALTSLIPSSKSPFRGSWAGSWSDTASLKNGTFSMIIGTNGALTGAVVNTTTQENGSLAGTVADNGALKVTQTYPTYTYVGSGTIEVNKAGHLIGNIQQKQDAAIVQTISIDLTKQL